ncbi:MULTISPECIES: ABC transporter ATP-binding protein [Pseudomonas]|uniref:ABC transporter ATP-binding protein n=1 Tax=Pseudomonas TaxID=286 RepID=UPI001DE5D197|nr:ABC transporter ATP-binding protein [Pseudomonas sp. Bi123]CAH0263900.1 Teichoic acids export ATP-binding protein TagH [Pseudomonas sp. Bi123]
MGTINVTGLGKAYKQYPSRASRLAEWIIPWSRPRHKLKWVLEDLNFQVRPGEAVGIIGVNGAGKSTLLKMITGTTQPTAGSVEISGRVAALLELGMGFHPDFTGRQNAIMAGQLLGLSVSEVTELMPKIEAFAEIGDYIDQPVRLYSSGMQMRLAFSVATARRPDVLIVDEALSVGDAYFQHKSFERIREFRKGGTTLLIVSHDKAAIQSICDRAILLRSGKLAMEGKPEEVMDYYNAMLAEKESANTVRQEISSDGRIKTVSGTGQATVAEINILNANGDPVEIIDVGAPVTLSVKVRVSAAIPRLVLGYMIKDRLGQTVFGTNTHHLQRAELNLVEGEELVYNFACEMNVGPGSYSIATALVSDDSHLSNNYEWRDLALVFNVVNQSKSLFAGACWMPLDLEIIR